MFIPKIGQFLEVLLFGSKTSISKFIPPNQTKESKPILENQSTSFE